MKKIDPHFFGPWAVITGASSGIGLEFARQLAANGINVALVARRTELLNQLGLKLQREYGVEFRVITADLANADSLTTVREATADLDVGLFVSSAGAGSPAAFLDETPSKQSAVIQVNISAQLVLTRHFAERLIERGRGGIELVSAMGADLGLPFMANESGTKAYLLMLGRALNWELKSQGVHVSVLLPSPTDTPIIEAFGFSKDNMPMAPMSVERCVDEALVALRKNRSSVLTGRLFRVLSAVLPASLMRAVNARMLGKAARRRVELGLV
ncbi:hypothetical protein BGP77_16750 [Saccharospirillum sp. MSK14-1]|uniref:SDR family NAD(P)-dependent oxidoreductase n=1 Tax=Saccharospirillum sp. MSK14-1 TaxID=1897632 RepID=UPI000D3582EE|nr:SDR family NAD(P)-dependent oxidoreductase [Saccharospirillum sp. MSK14-1]PTY38097.1 hypothetical protein BGP77_16750 [Saccharospirillum sp. MSK14-1]